MEDEASFGWDGLESWGTLWLCSGVEGAMGLEWSGVKGSALQLDSSEGGVPYS